MEIFEIKVGWKKKLRIFSPVIYCMIGGNFIYLKNYKDWFLDNFIIAELIILLVVVVFNMGNKERHVYAVIFNDELRSCTIKYYRLSLIKFEKTISYTDLNYTYDYALYRRKVPMTLKIRRKSRMVAEIREKYNLGWSNDDMKTVKSVIDNLLEAKTLPDFSL